MAKTKLLVMIHN